MTTVHYWNSRISPVLGFPMNALLFWLIWTKTPNAGAQPNPPSNLHFGLHFTSRNANSIIGTLLAKSMQIT
jgi:hypothetical protein